MQAECGHAPRVVVSKGDEAFLPARGQRARGGRQSVGIVTKRAVKQRDLADGAGTAGNAPRIDWLPSTKITDSSVIEPAARTMCSSWTRVMGELPHDPGALGLRQNAAEGRILAQSGAVLGLGEKFGAKLRPRLPQTLLPLGLQARIRPARHVLGEACDQCRIRIDFLNRDFDQPTQAGINRLMITRCHRGDYVRLPVAIGKRAGGRGCGWRRAFCARRRRWFWARWRGAGSRANSSRRRRRRGGASGKRSRAYQIRADFAAALTWCAVTSPTAKVRGAFSPATRSHPRAARGRRRRVLSLHWR